jgi:hypothetical protein
MKTETCFLCSCNGIETEIGEPYQTIWQHHAGGSTDCKRVRVCQECHDQSLYLPRELAEEQSRQMENCPNCR